MPLFAQAGVRWERASEVIPALPETRERLSKLPKSP
jgi:hypothetical protein